MYVITMNKGHAFEGELGRSTWEVMDGGKWKKKCGTYIIISKSKKKKKKKLKIHETVLNTKESYLIIIYNGAE